METCGKNYKINMHNFQPEHFREPVYCCDPDVVIMYKALFFHFLVVEFDSNVFLQPIVNPRNQVWYKRKINVSTVCLFKWVS